MQGEKEFHSPIFQRLFVWGEEQANQLWDDIDQLHDGQDVTRFLGAIVLQSRSKKASFAPKSYWIIDGQQRLTTLYILLLAIAESSHKAGEKPFAAELASTYLLNQLGDAAGTTKVRPTNRDLLQFKKLIDRLTWAQVKPAIGYGDESGSLTLMYARLQKQLKERVSLYGASYHQVLAALILERLKFVEIDLSADDDPHQVFDSLNNRGQRLETIDLVRNEVFQRFGSDYKGAETLYNHAWRSFEDSLSTNLGDSSSPSR